MYMKHTEQSPMTNLSKLLKEYLCIHLMYYYVRHKYTVSTKAEFLTVTANDSHNYHLALNT